jgi:signal peptidase II
LKRSREWTIFALGAAVLALDQLSKNWVRTSLIPGVPYDPIPLLRPIFSFTHVTNVGAAFGLLPQLRYVYPLINVAVITFILLSYRQLPTRFALVRLSLGLELGGAAGNLVDRLVRGYVVDFVDLNFWPLQEWPVFNVADSSVVVGVVLLAAFLLLYPSEKLFEQQEPAEEAAD